MVYTPRSPCEWEARAMEKRAKCAEAIPTSWRLPSHVLNQLKLSLEVNKNDLISLGIPRKSGILSDIELDITESSATCGPIEKLASGYFTAVQVVTAFSKRATIAQQLKLLDELRNNGQLPGPLDGFPVNLKDSFQIVGTQATLGLVAYLNDFSETNSSLVEILLSLGAVPFVQTNILQTLMTADSHNNMFGRVLNPRITALGAGGSSGGEGALIAFLGAPVGIGTDIASSIRIPALCCGTYGSKPTVGRIPYEGQKGCSNPGLKFVLISAGPLSNGIESLSTMTRLVINSRPARLDSTAIDVPWRKTPDMTGHKLNIGVLDEDPSYPLHPPIKHAVSQAISRQQESGRTLVKLTAEECNVAELTEITWGFFGLHSASGLVADAGEPPIPSRDRITSAFKRVAMTHLLDMASLSPLERLALLNVKRAAAVKAWRRVCESHGPDAVVGPAAQNTAVKYDDFGLPPYTAFLKILNAGHPSFYQAT
ncbi:fatty-acid amide hydrolase [Fusarium beomiforme]|uniref:amidase n=1 Tax=Fusarium beomiforme TaxID=44412 RepID=A0A9P5ADW8_9HYPO|nr:fatty-acid amide hydrolase [Fusarium beomiforme]